MFEIDLDLIKKYDKPGPRYTSYPTAPQFHEGFTSKEFLDEIVRTNENETAPDLSLYFHIPYCDTLCYFCGCNMVVTKNRDRIHNYIDYVKREAGMLCRHIRPGRKARQLHWGGGTPTHLRPDEISELISHINSSFEIAPNAEIGCEIDPRELTLEHLEALRNGGFNRISMGVQDFNKKVQEAVNRIQPEKMTRDVVQWVRDLAFDSINLDLIYGLPHQSEVAFQDTIEKVIDISPDRVALFNFAHIPWLKKHQKLIKEDDLPHPEEKLNMLKMSVAKLTEAGYVFIGMDHFAKPDDELSLALKSKKLYRNFQGYSTHAGLDIYALGVTSISQLQHIYAQNFKQENDYYYAIDCGNFPVTRGYALTEDDKLRRSVIMKLMCNFELDFAEIEREFSIDFKDYFSAGLEQLHGMTDDGLITVNGDKIVVNDTGRLLIRNIAMNFDGFLEKQKDNTRYSRTI